MTFYHWILALFILWAVYYVKNSIFQAVGESEQRIINYLYTLRIKIELIQRKEEELMHTLDDAVAKVKEVSGKADSMIELMTTIKKKLDAVLSGVELPAEVQAKIDEIFDIDESTAQKITAAIDANDDDPNTPPPTPEPAP